MHKYNINVFINSPLHLQEYYRLIKNNLKCDILLYNIEKDICTKLYTEYFKVYTPDYLLNTKISLYKNKILPVHLNIKEYIPQYFINLIIPSDFIEEYLKYIKSCYKICKDHDTLLSMLIFSILKSGERDIKKKILFINTYRRKIFINCEHKTKMNEEEISYYLRLLEISVMFIERMEFKDLNISKEEYDRMII